MHSVTLPGHPVLVRVQQHIAEDYLASCTHSVASPTGPSFRTHPSSDIMGRFRQVRFVPLFRICGFGHRAIVYKRIYASNLIYTSRHWQSDFRGTGFRSIWSTYKGNPIAQVLFMLVVTSSSARRTVDWKADSIARTLVARGSAGFRMDELLLLLQERMPHPKIWTVQL